MANTIDNNVAFIDQLQDYDISSALNGVIHILCTAGNMSFIVQDVLYNIAPKDYVILPNPSLASGFSWSSDFKAVAMRLSEIFIRSLGIRSDYGIIGHLSLLQNPVMRLSEHDYGVCLDGMTNIRKRMETRDHLFRDEMIGNLMNAHILDLYDIHARMQAQRHVSERTAALLWRFVEMLHQGEYVTNRNLEHYSSRLCVTPHYLSEVCRKACGRPATYWIDRFTTDAIMRMLADKDIPLTTIAERFNFSSLSYFSRYVQKHVGVSPSDYRKNNQSNVR